MKETEYADVGRNNKYHTELRRGNFLESGHSRDHAVDGEAILSGCTYITSPTGNGPSADRKFAPVFTFTCSIILENLLATQL
jgi:hypothetical protein